MKGAVQRVKGTRDLLPPETAVWAAVEEVARRVFGLYGYDEIRTPLLEPTELFVRTVGESTDIVGKEMYSFLDRKGRGVTLRPESTASVARAFVENGLQSWPLPVKLFYIGPQFRYERPQKGRYRQFHQIGAELLGEGSPASDAELLVMLDRFLRELGFQDQVVLLNTVGDAASRAAYRQALVEYLEPHSDALGADSRRRLEINPLRILDTKAPEERRLLEGAPRLSSHLTEEARAHFAAVCRLLERFAVPFRVEERLVRGLDYYTDTVFEIAAQGLGAQDAILGGGRYDDLVGQLGGPKLPSIGFAIGEDRLLEVLPEAFRSRSRPQPALLVVPVGEVPAEEILALCEEVRQGGRRCQGELGGRSLKASLKRADRLGARRVLILGEEELASGVVTLRDLAGGTQRRVRRSELSTELDKDEGSSDD